MKYYRFNNSRSEKLPMILWGFVNNNGLRVVAGGQFSGVPKGSIEVSEDEYNQVVESDKQSQNIEVGKRVVAMEYTPKNKRYGIVTEIYTFDKGGSTEHQRVKLDNGDDWMMRDVRLDTFIHRLEQLK